MSSGHLPGFITKSKQPWWNSAKIHWVFDRFDVLEIIEAAWSKQKRKEKLIESYL